MNEKIVVEMDKGEFEMLLTAAETGKIVANSIALKFGHDALAAANEMILTKILEKAKDFKVIKKES